MSSRSGSAVSSSVPASDNNTSDRSKLDKTDDLIEERDRKLTELYCVSRLNQLLELTDESRLRKEIDGFLKKNDIRRGTRFDDALLPKFLQLAVTSKTKKKSKEASLINISNQTPTDSKIGTELQDSAEKIAANPENHYVPNRNNSIRENIMDSLTPVDKTGDRWNKRPIESPIGSEEQRPEKRQKTHSQSLESSNGSEMASLPISPRPPVPSALSHYAYYENIEYPPADPTTIEPTEKFKDPLIKTIMGKKVETSDHFNEHNIDASETVFLLMNDYMPSKIPQALPLAELKYMSQTLPLINLIPRAHKTLTTDIINNALNEARITVVGSRIEELRRLGLWSLRQPKRFIDPWKQDISHQNILLKEAKWMQADFKEGQKYKMAMCATMAQAVNDYWNYGEICCVGRKIITKDEGITPSSDECIVESSNKLSEISTKDAQISTPGNDGANTSTDANDTGCNDHAAAADDDNDDDKDDNKIRSSNDLDLRHSGPIQVGHNDRVVPSIDTELLLRKPSSFNEAVATPHEAAALSLSIGTEEPRNALASQFKLTIFVNEFNAFEKTLVQDLPVYSGINDEVPNKNEPLPFIPISKSVVTLDDNGFYKLLERQLIDDEPSISQLSKRRGMFYGNRRNHYLRPPAVPSLRYLQNRTPTIWLSEDDQELVKNINTYGYNWELISAHMTHHLTCSYLSNIERRTPWQCFERFVQLNERFNFSDLKGPRAHGAQQWLIEAHKFQQRQNRRISPLGVNMESIQRGHRRLRWASMFEAIRKCMKKRENTPRPNPTQPRKPLDCKNMKVPTPAEMSLLKAQRDEALRRDIQLRRTVKNRLQQRQQQQSLQARNSSRAQSPVPSNGNASANLPRSGQASTPRQNQKQYTEQDIIESYSRKLLEQKPELTPDTALKAAKNYYRTLKEQQQQLKQQQIQQQRMQSQEESNQVQPQPQSQSQTVPQTQNASPSQATPSGLLNINSATKIKSPTPQEILQRFQK
ncbi:chromatin modification- protein VID21 [Saccharomyces pastorianus]|uniref:Chromatin modification-related protein EAF1 n=1 Tax=Saccharomyces pastorianus TaxID=27292 RepID=A0A6C1E2V8_SACPS|nr:chromatin modification- protein VID21 [Saccharomyces pastorianus]